MTAFLRYITIATIFSILLGVSDIFAANGSLGDLISWWLDGSNITDQSITSTKFSPGSINSAKISDGSIGGAKVDATIQKRVSTSCGSGQVLTFSGGIMGCSTATVTTQNGACGSAAGWTFATEPTTGLCASSGWYTPDPLVLSGSTWSWVCLWSGEPVWGNSITCSATKTDTSTTLDCWDRWIVYGDCDSLCSGYDPADCWFSWDLYLDPGQCVFHKTTTTTVDLWPSTWHCASGSEGCGTNQYTCASWLTNYPTTNGNWDCRNSAWNLIGKCVLSGVCGSANGATLSSAPTDPFSLCSRGTATAVSGTGPWTWTCKWWDNTVTTDDANCSANKTVLTNACGTANWWSFATAPTTGLCNSAYAVYKTNSMTSPTSDTWAWICTLSASGVDKPCEAIRTAPVSNVIFEIASDSSTNWDVGCPGQIPMTYCSDFVSYSISPTATANLYDPSGNLQSNWVVIRTSSGCGICDSTSSIETWAKWKWKLIVTEGSSTMTYYLDV